MKKCREKARELAQRYNNCDVENICENLGIIVIRQDLPQSVNGFTISMHDIPFIVVNSNMNYYKQRFTIAHELGHTQLHGETNTLNLSLNTAFCVNKYEREADCFAAYLLLYLMKSEFEYMDTLTAEYVSQVLHIPPEKQEDIFEDGLS